MSQLNATLIAHADWSSSEKKRFLARAVQSASGRFRAFTPVPAGDPRSLFSRLRDEGNPEGAVLLGFDFPIGLPMHYARLTGIDNFLDLLPELGQGKWGDFFSPADHPDKIGPYRPFYPARPGGARYIHLFKALEASSMDALRRQCELAYPGRRAACPLFWTLGGQQVGKAAICGWRDILAPALGPSLSLAGQEGQDQRPSPSCQIWPFSGLLPDLLQPGSLVIAECYPGEYYRHLNVSFSPHKPGERSGKRVQSDRQRNAPALLAWAEMAGVEVSPHLQAEILDGFGSASDGEDRFDAVIGLFGMLNVVLGRQPCGEPPVGTIRTVEGWILGQAWV